MTVTNKKLEFNLANEEENTASLSDEIESLKVKLDELNEKIGQLETQNESSEKRHGTEMRHHCLLLFKANESCEASSKKIDELAIQVNRYYGLFFVKI